MLLDPIYLPKAGIVETEGIALGCLQARLAFRILPPGGCFASSIVGIRRICIMVPPRLEPGAVARRRLPSIGLNPNSRLVFLIRKVL